MDYLRKEGTNQVYPRTAILAKRSDMIAISEEEAMELRKALNAENKTNAEQAKIDGNRRVELPNEAKEAVKAKTEKTLAEMSKEELVKIAKKEKIYIRKDATDDSIREKIKESTGRE